MKRKTSLWIAALAMSVFLTMNAQNQSMRGVDPQNLDTTVSPKTDFYEYACGGWMKNNPLKPEFSRYGIFDQLAELNREQVKDLILGLAATNPAPGTNAQKIADIYALGMDSVKLNADSRKTIAKDVRIINTLKRKDLPRLLATMPGVSAFFATGVEADIMNSDVNAMYVVQSGLGLGDRDYYLSEDENEVKVLNAYRTYLTKLGELAGLTPQLAKAMANSTIRIEKRLAKASMSREELRNPIASYNPMAMTDAQKRWPSINLSAYFKAKGLEGVDTLIIGQPAFLDEVEAIISNHSIGELDSKTTAKKDSRNFDRPTIGNKSSIVSDVDLRNYILAGYLQSASPYLSDDFIKANFELAKVKNGVQEMQPRWKRAVNVPNSILGEALGQLYVEKYFPQSSKEKMLTLVRNLQKALGEHITNLEWMTPETKEKAIEKLKAFTVKIGYPDKWRDYSKLEIDPKKSYWENIQAAILFNDQYNMDDYGRPVDKERWFMSPQTVNAYYNPTSNEICFPAGILQAPYFDPNADDAENYGAIGVVIGHEMTHGFDDQGRQFDKDGNFADWWTAKDSEAFNALANKLVDQFNEIIVEGDTHANGKFTLGENIADQGGLRVAYTAYHNSLGDNAGEVIDGFTPDQRFYLAYAHVWSNNIRPAEILSRTKSDPHSLGRWRVNATLRNIQPFFDAFSITEGDAMFRPVNERVVIW